ncbi:hypothetical protein CF65_02911 [Aggregatibacter actinomycetemcomitans HK1651]|nr:hypothetical protein CF65_02911 [Aggregatibacter actinomycetemcomitans HK1651]
MINILFIRFLFYKKGRTLKNSIKMDRTLLSNRPRVCRRMSVFPTVICWVH